MRVLIVEDERPLADAIARGLRREGMAVDVALDGDDGHEKVSITRYDVVVLDRDLPGMSGDELCRKIVAGGALSRVLMLTASGGVADRVEGLSLGADDYLTKPFEIEELEARLRALLRRAASPLKAELRLGPLAFDQNTRMFTLAGAPFQLSAREHAILEALLRRAGGAVSKESLLESTYGFDDEVNLSVIEVVVHRLRKKLEGSTVSIATLRGLGYVLRTGSP